MSNDECEDENINKNPIIPENDIHWNFLQNQFVVVQYNQVEDYNSRFKIFYLKDHDDLKNSSNFILPIFDSKGKDL